MDLLMNGSIEKRSELTFNLISNGNESIEKKDLENFVKEMIDFSSHSHYDKF